MADQLVLSWTIDVSGTPLGPAGAAALLGAVPLYQDAATDPVLGQLFGLTVADDATTTGATTATRTLTLNMNAVGSPEAPPTFPCHPDVPQHMTLPYILRRAVALSGSFFVTTGSLIVPTTGSQEQTLSIGDTVQFMSQQGVFYTVAAVGPTTITLTGAYTGKTANTTASKSVLAPVTNAALYSSSPLDTNGVATTPAIPAGPGARTIEITYNDSTGAGPFTVSVNLTGKRPAAVTLAGGSVDIAEIVKIVVVTSGSFANSVGQITLVELSDTLPAIPTNATRDQFQVLTDEAQLLLGNTLAYVPPSYFAIAQQGGSQPALVGDFFVTTGSERVKTSEDQTAVLNPGDVIQFASQLVNATMSQTREVFYTVSAVSPKWIELEEPYSGFDTNHTGGGGTQPIVAQSGTKGNLGASVYEQATAAFVVNPSPAAPPTNDQLSGPLAQFVATETAGPPPNPPLDPATVPTPTFLSGMFAQTLQMALAVPVTPETITFL